MVCCCSLFLAEHWLAHQPIIHKRRKQPILPLISLCPLRWLHFISQFVLSFFKFNHKWRWKRRKDGPFGLVLCVCFIERSYGWPPAHNPLIHQAKQTKLPSHCPPQEQQLASWTVPLGAMAAAKQIHLFFPLGREEKNEFCCCWWPAVQPSSSIIKQINFTLLNCFIV